MTVFGACCAETESADARPHCSCSMVCATFSITQTAPTGATRSLRDCCSARLPSPLRRDMQGQPIPHGQRSGPFDPSGYPTSVVQRCFQKLPLARMSWFQFLLARKDARPVLHVDNKRGSILRLQTRRRGYMGEIRKPANNNGCAQPFWPDIFKPDFTGRCGQFLGADN